MISRIRIWIHTPVSPPPKSTWPTFLKILFQTTKINQAACDLAKGVAQEGGALFAGSICQTASLYSSGAGQKVVKEKFREQIEIFLQNDVDLLIAEVFPVCFLSVTAIFDFTTPFHHACIPCIGYV